MADSLLANIDPVASVTGDMELYVNVPGTPDTDGLATVDQVVTYAGGIFVPSARTVSADTGLTGGGDLSANRTIGLDSASVASLGKADTALQPGSAPTAHAASHVTGGSDKIRDATAAQDGLMTVAYAGKLDNIEAGADVTDATNVAVAVAGAPAKTVLVDDDLFAGLDSEDGNSLMKVTWAAIKARLQAFFDTLYVALTGNQTVAGVKTFSSFPVTPSSAPTTDYEVANKKYVDDNSGSAAAALVTESTTSRTLGLSDANKYIRLTNGSSCTITLPNQATVVWLADTEIYFRVAAAGIPTFTLGGSVVLNDPKGIVAALVQGDTFAIKRVASDTWDLI